MFISATINELTREIKWDKSQVAAVDGDYAVNGFKLTCLGLDPDYNLTTGTWYAVFTAQDGTSHSNPLTVSDGVVTWEFDNNINKGGSGVVKFFLYAVTANTAGKILKRWDSAITDLRVAGTIDYENQEEEAARESEIDRLAGLVTTLTATAATINDVKAVLSRITNSSPVVVATVADLSGLDVTEHQLAIVRADGYLYYYDGSEWQQGIKYGSYELDTTLTEFGKAADAAAVGAELSKIKEDLDENVSDLKSALNTIAGSEYDATIWQQGAINITTGADAPSESRIRSAKLSKKVVSINVNTGYYAIICVYEGDTYKGWWTGSAFSKADSGATQFTGTVNLAALLSAYNVRLYMISSNGTRLSPPNDYQCVEFIKYTDDTLSKAGIPADAKATGDKIDTLYTESQPYVSLTKSSDAFTVEDGYYATTGNKIALAGYRLCYFTATEDFNFYFDAETLSKSFALFASIYNTSIASGNNVICYKRTDNNLPSQASQASISKGQILAISIYTPSSSPADFGLYANYKKLYTLNNEMLLAESQIQQVLAEVPGGGAEKFTNFAYGKKIAWFGDSISELKQLPHTAGTLMNATVYDCSIRGSTIGRTYSNFDKFSFYNLVTAIIAGDFQDQFDQLDAYEQSQGQTYPGIRANLTTLSQLDFDEIDYVVLLQGTNDFGITAVHAAEGYNTKVDEMQARMDDAISRFITAYPKLKFYIISPPFRATPTEDYYQNTLADYIAAEQEVAEKYAMPFYNLLTHSRICNENKTTYMNSDGGVYVHPNAYGDDWLAELAAKFILEN